MELFDIALGAILIFPIGLVAVVAFIRVGFAGNPEERQNRAMAYTLLSAVAFMISMVMYGVFMCAWHLLH